MIKKQDLTQYSTWASFQKLHPNVKIHPNVINVLSCCNHLKSPQHYLLKTSHPPRLHGSFSSTVEKDVKSQVIHSLNGDRDLITGP